MNLDQPRTREQLSLALGACGALIGVICSLVFLPERTPLVGDGSLRHIGSIVASAVTGVAFLVTMILNDNPGLPRRRRIAWFRRALDIVGLTTVHAGLAFLLGRGVFWTFSGAFVGLLLDRGSTAFVMALTCAVAGYAAAGSAARLSTESLAKLMGVFMVAGAMASALSSSDPAWWHEHFSALGTVWDLSGFWFNFTLIVSGLVLITLADFLTHDLRLWSQIIGRKPWRVRAIWFGFVLLGLAVGLVGSIPVNVNLTWHTRAAYGAAYVFAALVLAVPVLVGNMPKSFVAVSIVVVTIIIVGGKLRSSAYITTTGFEMIAVGMVFLWLLLLVRTVAATLQELTFKTGAEPAG